MGNTFASAVHVRTVGALLGAAYGVIVIAAGLVLADGPAEATTAVLGATVSVLAAPLGWMFAPMAIRPGTRSALRSAAALTLIAVPSGALILGMAMALGGDDLTYGEVVGAGIGLAFVGLLFFGLPLAGLTFVAAGIWVVILRVICRGSRGQNEPA